VWRHTRSNQQSIGLSELDEAIPEVNAVNQVADQVADISVPEVSNVVAPDIETLSQVADLSAVPDLETIALVTGQENYGLAIVLLGEAIWSLSKAPSLDHALKTLVPAGIAAAILVAVSGPMVTSGNLDDVGTGLFIATGVSVLMGVVYLARCLAPFSPSPKEIPALGVLVALAGFFSFSQNLVVDGFVTLPTLPSVTLPSFPEIQLPF